MAVSANAISAPARIWLENSAVSFPAARNWDGAFRDWKHEDWMKGALKRVPF
jgi:hypothetical protein